MQKKSKRWMAFCLIMGIMMVQAAGCSRNEVSEEHDYSESDTSEGVGTNGDSIVGDERNNENEKNGKNKKNGENGDGGRIEQVGKNGEIIVTAYLGEDGEKSISYFKEDLETGWKDAAATKIVLDDEKISVDGRGALVSDDIVTITAEGTYLVSGKLSDGQIRIAAGDDAQVRLILNGVELTNQNTSPLYGEGKGKVILTLAEGTTNLVRDGSKYIYENPQDDEPDAPIFINGDLTINGTGKLIVEGNYQSGIRSKDVLKVMSGNISVSAQDDGLKGRDAVIIRDGVLEIAAVKDGIKSNNDKDEEKGFVWIDGGQISIAAEDDGIQAETALIVCGGEINVTKSQEGLAGKTVDILGGFVQAVTQDDGINAAASVESEREKMQNQDGVYLRIAGGEVRLNAMADGIDSNGDFYMEGGSLYLSGPVSHGDGIFDYNGEGMLVGGTVFAAGSSGMMQTFGENSMQNYLVVYGEERQKAGTVIFLTNDDGEELGSYAPDKDFDTVIISSPRLEAGKRYCVAFGDSVMEIEVTEGKTEYGTRPEGTNLGRRENPGGRRHPEGGELPEGGRPLDGERLPERGKPMDEERPPEGGKPWDEGKLPEDGIA